MESILNVISHQSDQAVVNHITFNLANGEAVTFSGNSRKLKLLA